MGVVPTATPINASGSLIVVAADARAALAAAPPLVRTVRACDTFVRGLNSGIGWYLHVRDMPSKDGPRRELPSVKATDSH